MKLSCFCALAGAANSTTIAASANPIERLGGRRSSMGSLLGVFRQRFLGLDRESMAALVNDSHLRHDGSFRECLIKNYAIRPNGERVAYSMCIDFCHDSVGL